MGRWRLVLGFLVASGDGPPVAVDAHGTENAIAGWAGATPVVVDSAVNAAKIAVWSGTGSVNDAATWRSERVGGKTQRPSLAVGPRGRGWLVYDRNAGTQVRAIRLNVNRLLTAKRSRNR